MTEQTNQPQEITEPKLTTEQIDNHYSALHDSVDLINGLITEKPENMSEQDRKDTISRNAEHLKIMEAKTFWHAKHDLKSTRDCIKAATAFLAK